MDNLLFQKFQQEAVVYVSGSQEGMESHGLINSGPHSSSLSPTVSSGRFGNIIKGYSPNSAKLWKQVSVHRTLRPIDERAYQYKVLPFGLSLSPRVFRKVAEAALERTGHEHSELPRRLAHTGSVSGSVMRTQGFGAFATQPVGPSGQLKKEQTLTNAEDLFSRYGVGLIQSDSGHHAGTCSVGVELLEYGQEQDGGITETILEVYAPVACRNSSGVRII